MNSTETVGWQIVLADLSLILFLTTLAGLSQLDRQPDAGAVLPHEALGAVAVPPAAPRQSLYLVGTETTPFAQWLRLESRDHRAALTIHAQYRPQAETRAWNVALALAREARAQGYEPQMVFVAGDSERVWASFAFEPVGALNAAGDQAFSTRSRPSSLAR